MGVPGASSRPRAGWESADEVTDQPGVRYLPELDGAILGPTGMCIYDAAIALVLTYPIPAGDSGAGLGLRSRDRDRRQVHRADAAAEATNRASAREVAAEHGHVSGEGRLSEGPRKARTQIAKHPLLDSIGNRPGANGLRGDSGRLQLNKAGVDNRSDGSVVGRWEDPEADGTGVRCYQHGSQHEPDDAQQCYGPGNPKHASGTASVSERFPEPAKVGPLARTCAARWFRQAMFS
jgi:hypothetical protein